MNIGYWEPHTSSINFCETDYIYTKYVVEIHNVWSSIIGISGFGLLGLIQSFFNNNNNKNNTPINEWRVIISYIILLLTGIGSSLLHGTLHWLYQSSDELPMIYLILSLLYSISEYDAPINKPNYPFLSYTMIFIVLFNTIIYYTFQNLYWVFLLTFSTGATTVIWWLSQLAYNTNNKLRRKDDESIRVFQRGVIAYTCIGTPVWILDMILCDYIIIYCNKYLYGMTPHIIWHIAAGFGGYCATLFILCCRCEVLNVQFNINYIVFGIIPVLSVVVDSNDDKQS